MMKSQFLMVKSQCLMVVSLDCIHPRWAVLRGHVAVARQLLATKAGGDRWYPKSPWVDP
jgi:hypothetical protein